MRIAMIGHKGIPSRYGGIETHVTELSTRLAHAGHEVIAYGRRWYCERRQDRFNGVKITFVPTIRTKHLDAIVHTFFATLHACFIARADVLHYHGVGPALLSWIPRLVRPQATVITTFHCIDRHHGKWGAFARTMLKLGERASLRFAHETITVSKTLATYIALQYGVKATYIPNGITPVATATHARLLAPFHLKNYRYVAMVSRLVPHKGAHTLIDAWRQARALSPQVLKDYKLAIVGGSSFTDAYEASLKAQALGDDSIVFTGYQTGPTLKSLFAGAAFVAHPSLSEGLPIAVLEAMSYGKAVLASDIPESMEVIEEHGVSFAAGSVGDLAEKIIELAADPMHTASVGHAARTFVESEYNWDDIAHETMQVYRKHQELREGVLAVG